MFLVKDLKKKVNEGKHANKRKDVVKAFSPVDRAKPGEVCSAHVLIYFLYMQC